MKMRCGDNCGYWWQDEDEDYPSCHFDSDTPGLLPANTMGKRTIPILTMTLALILMKVPMLVIVKSRAQSVLFLHLDVLRLNHPKIVLAFLENM